MMKQMKHKFAYGLAFIALVCLLFSCSLKTGASQDYRAVKPEYEEQKERLLMGGMLRQTLPEDAFAVKEETCTHEFGSAYRMSEETHCPVCRRCGKAMEEEEPHSDVSMRLIQTKDGVFVYGMQCAVCSKERINAAAPPFFAYLVTKNAPSGEVS